MIPSFPCDTCYHNNKLVKSIYAYHFCDKLGHITFIHDLKIAIFNCKFHKSLPTESVNTYHVTLKGKLNDHYIEMSKTTGIPVSELISRNVEKWDSHLRFCSNERERL
jgi:hypothetical protein